MDSLLISQCIQIYDEVLSTKLGRFLEKKFSQMPQNSIYYSLFEDCRNSLKTESFKTADEWLSYVNEKFDATRRALNPSNDLSLGLETILQILQDKISAKSSTSPFNLASELERINSKIQDLLPFFPDNMAEFRTLLTKEEPKYHVDYQIPTPRSPPTFSITELDILVSKLRNLKTDKQVADIMDILQHYETTICQDSDDEISVNFNTLDPFTTEKVKHYIDSLPK